MGWWNMGSRGGISINNTGTVMGDGPADIMDEALKKITKEYNRAWSRNPTTEELWGCFNFCICNFGDGSIKNLITEANNND